MSQAISLVHCRLFDQCIPDSESFSVWMIEPAKRNTTRIPRCICLWMKHIYFFLTHFSPTQHEMNYPGNGWEAAFAHSDSFVEIWQADRASQQGEGQMKDVLPGIRARALMCGMRLCAVEKQGQVFVCCVFSPRYLCEISRATNTWKNEQQRTRYHVEV